MIFLIKNWVCHRKMFYCSAWSPLSYIHFLYGFPDFLITSVEVIKNGGFWTMTSSLGPNFLLPSHFFESSWETRNIHWGINPNNMVDEGTIRSPINYFFAMQLRTCAIISGEATSISHPKRSASFVFVRA